MWQGLAPGPRFSVTHVGEPDLATCCPWHLKSGAFCAHGGGDRSRCFVTELGAGNFLVTARWGPRAIFWSRARARFFGHAGSRFGRRTCGESPGAMWPFRQPSGVARSAACPPGPTRRHARCAARVVMAAVRYAAGGQRHDRAARSPGPQYEACGRAPLQVLRAARKVLVWMSTPLVLRMGLRPLVLGAPSGTPWRRIQATNFSSAAR